MFRCSRVPGIRAVGVPGFRVFGVYLKRADRVPHAYGRLGAFIQLSVPPRGPSTTREANRGISLIRNSPSPWDHHGTSGIVLLKGPRRVVFLMSEVPHEDVFSGQPHAYRAVARQGQSQLSSYTGILGDI